MEFTRLCDFCNAAGTPVGRGSALQAERIPGRGITPLRRREVDQAELTHPPAPRISLRVSVDTIRPRMAICLAALLRPPELKVPHAPRRACAGAPCAIDERLART